MALSSSSRRILIADDDAAAVVLLRMIFECEGYTVEIALNGAMLVRLAFAFQPDLILTDLDMPYHTGLEAARILRADARTAHIPIILVTGHDCLDGQPLAQVARASGLQGALRKPVDFSALLALVDQVLATTPLARAVGDD